MLCTEHMAGKITVLSTLKLSSDQEFVPKLTSNLGGDVCILHRETCHAQAVEQPQLI